MGSSLRYVGLEDSVRKSADAGDAMIITGNQNPTLIISIH